jgi:hypothetical protein
MEHVFCYGLSHANSFTEDRSPHPFSAFEAIVAISLSNDAQSTAGCALQ